MTLKNGHNQKDLLVGAAVGSLLGGVTALLMAPKAGKKLRRDINDVYCDLTDRTHDMADQVSKRGKAIAKTVSTHSHDLADKAKCVMCDVKNFIGCAQEEIEEQAQNEDTRDLLIGGVIGGLLGAVAGLLLAPKSGSELREDIAETYEDVSEKTHDMADQVSKKGKAFAKNATSQANKWIDLAKEVVEGLSDEAKEKGEEFADQAKGRMNDMMQWAALGFRVWKAINNKSK